MAPTATLHGSDDFAETEAVKYKSPKEFKSQDDTRVIRDLQFSYTVETTDAAGNSVIVSRLADRDAEVRVDQIGLLALKKGEDNHSFYTDDELDRKSRTGRETAAPAEDTDISSLGEVELAEWLQTGKGGKPFTMDEVLEAVGDDKDLAHRMLAAENIASDGDPRAGLEKGLTSIIES